MNIDPTGNFSMVSVGVTMAVGGIINASLTYAFNFGNVSAKQLWGSFLFGAVTAPVGGLLVKVLGPLLRSSLQPFLRAIGAMNRISLVGRSATEKLLVKMSRILLNTNKHYPSVGSTTLGRILKRAYPNVKWQQHHVFIQQAWSKAGSSHQLYDDVLANEGLRRIGNGVWNLLPIPASLNNWLGKSPLATQIVATVYYSIIVYGGIDVALLAADL
jgi:hypothetical protein